MWATVVGKCFGQTLGTPSWTILFLLTVEQSKLHGRNHRKAGPAQQRCRWLVQWSLIPTHTMPKHQPWKQLSHAEEGGAWAPREPSSGSQTQPTWTARSGLGPAAGRGRKTGWQQLWEQPEGEERWLGCAKVSEVPPHPSWRLASQVCSLTLAGNIKYAPHTRVQFLLIRISRFTDSNFGPIFKLGEGGT